MKKNGLENLKWILNLWTHVRFINDWMTAWRTILDDIHYHWFNINWMNKILSMFLVAWNPWIGYPVSPPKIKPHEQGDICFFYALFNSVVQNYIFSWVGLQKDKWICLPFNSLSLKSFDSPSSSFVYDVLSKMLWVYFCCCCCCIVFHF